MIDNGVIDNMVDIGAMIAIVVGYHCLVKPTDRQIKDASERDCRALSRLTGTRRSSALLALYSTLLERQRGQIFRDASSLPASKDELRKVHVAELVIERDPRRRQQVTNSYLQLALYQDGVGQGLTCPDDHSGEPLSQAWAIGQLPRLDPSVCWTLAAHPETTMRAEVASNEDICFVADLLERLVSAEANRLKAGLKADPSRGEGGTLPILMQMSAEELRSRYGLAQSVR